MKTQSTSAVEPDPTGHPEAHAPQHHAGHGNGNGAGPHALHPHDAKPPRPGQIAGRLLLVAIVVGGLLTMGAVPRMKQNKKLAAMAAAKEEEATLVQIVRPHEAIGATSSTLPGNVQAVEETAISARTSGYLKQRFVDIGSHVKAGQVLAVVEAPELDQQLARARAEASKSKAGHEQAEADIVKLNANVEQAQSEVSRMRFNLETARADLAHANAKLVETQGARSEAQAKLQQAQKRLVGQRAELTRARARASLAGTTLKRFQVMERGGAVSGQALDERQADYDAAAANVTVAQAGVDSALADIEAAKHAIESRDGDVQAATADVAAAGQKIKAAETSIASAQSTVDAMQASVRAGKANARAAQAGIEASQATVKSYASLIGFEQIKAPFDGIITARNVDKGSLINAGSNSGSALDPTTTVPHSGLFGIARTDVLRVQVQVPQPMIKLAKVGQRARVLFQEYPGRSFEGLVSQTAGALDATSRTLLTEIRVNNRDGALMPGMYAQVQFLTPQTRSAIRIPANTLVVDGSGVRVATVGADKKVHFRPVKVGKDYGKELEIVEGLIGNEQLITDPTDELTEGMKVRIQTASASNPR
jgi:RND family efflux transporter MFP subunit